MEYAYLPGTVRERIQDLIKERKITQAELADQIGMSDGALSRFLSGRTDKIGDDAIIKSREFSWCVQRFYSWTDRLPGAPQL